MQHQNTTDDNLIIKAISASILVSVVIIISKIAGWFLTESPSILASFTDSFLDIAASFINFIAAKYALQPPDTRHRFGYGKAEDLAVLTQSSFFFLSAVFVIMVSAKRLLVPKPTEYTEVGIYIMLFSTFITLLLIYYQTIAIKKTHSTIVTADRLHYSMDLLTNVVVIVSLGSASFFNSHIIDPLFAICIGLYILYQALKLLKKAFQNLMDHEFDSIDKEKLKKIILSHPDAKGFHELKTRYAGRKTFIQFHLELDTGLSFQKAHEITEEIEEAILKEFFDAEVIIHQDPAGVHEPKKFKD